MYSFESVVRYSEVDAHRHMTLTALLELLQDCCIFQSENLGIGMDYLAKMKRAWVLSSWQVIVKRYPLLGEKVTAYTWAYDCKGFYGYRNFKVVDGQGETVAYANSIWIFMDTEKMRPARIPEELLKVYSTDEPLDMETAGRKLSIEGDCKKEDPVPVQKFHLDTNLHVNNSKYVLIAREYLPECFKIGELRAEYRKAAVLKDVFYPRTNVREKQVTVSLENEEGKPYAIVEFIEEN
ncbi:MAG: thioesterase [Roseburia sp.]|nr:thioesterase [Roseburia sp.]